MNIFWYCIFMRFNVALKINTFIAKNLFSSLLLMLHSVQHIPKKRLTLTWLSFEKNEYFEIRTTYVSFQSYINEDYVKSFY